MRKSKVPYRHHHLVQQLQDDISPRSTMDNTLKSTVRMSETGAEVTLYSGDDQRNDYETPEKQQRWIMGSLLDLEVSPSFSRTSADTCLPLCGLASCCQVVDTHHQKFESVQQQIFAILDSPAPVGHWIDVCHIKQQLLMTTTTSPNAPENKLRSRISVANSRKHVAKVKRELHPFDEISQNTVPMQKTQSYDAIKLSKMRGTPSPTKPFKGGLDSWIYEWGCHSGIPEDFVVYEDTENGYESDPEDFIRRPRRGIDERYYNNENDHLNTSHDSNLSALQIQRIVNSEEVVQEFMNKRFTFVHHGYPERSTGCTAWIERGQRFGSNLVQPRFCWSRGHVYDESSSKVIRQNAQVQHLDLLDIQRIVPVTKVDRERYPFARVGHLFIIQGMNQQNVMFEARSREERIEFTESLKLTVARFGSKIIVGEFIDDEFFAGMPMMGPGDEPQWVHAAM